MRGGYYLPLVTLRILLAFAATWFIWGSTYLAIAFAVRELPPLLVAAVRNLTAGMLLFGWVMARGGPRPSRRQWKQTAVVGFLLLGLGNGAITWSARTEPTGVIALMVALVPLWLLVFGWLGRRGVRPAVLELIGVALGVVGIALLALPDGTLDSGVTPIGFLVLLGSTLAWSGGSLYSRQLDPHPVPLGATGMEMMAGGLFLLVASALAGEWSEVDLSGVTPRGALSMVYLIVFGSVISFSAYKWLLGQVRPALAGTYAFVNPVVAVTLGWAFAGELITPRLLAAMALIVTAVATISLRPYFSRP
jgi:drug/metabolite transporter (DMT)-like permease